MQTPLGKIFSNCFLIDILEQHGLFHPNAYVIYSCHDNIIRNPITKNLFRKMARHGNKREISYLDSNSSPHASHKLLEFFDVA
jgi:hypothetical protein